MTGCWRRVVSRAGVWRPGPVLRLPPHRASSATLAAAYPFLVPPAMDLGVPLGVDVLTGQPFCFDPWALYDAGALTNPNMLLAGVIGQGKSALAKSLAIRAIGAGRRVVVPGDPKGEWGVVAEAVGGTSVRLGPGLPARVNPLDTPGTGRASVLAAIAELLLGRTLLPAEHSALDAALEGLTGQPAVVGDALRELAHPDAGRAVADGITTQQRAHDARDLIHVLRRLTRGDLAGLIDAPSTIRPDPASPMTVLDLSALHQDDTALAVAMTAATAHLSPAQAPAWGAPLTPQLVIYDEGWRLLQTPSQLRRMQSEWKLARATRTANLLIVHRISDLSSSADQGSARRGQAVGLLADCSVRIIYRQESDQIGVTADALALNGVHRQVVPHLPRGEGLWLLGPRSYLVRHFVQQAETEILATDPQDSRSRD